jgi:hypothetical protein
VTIAESKVKMLDSPATGAIYRPAILRAIDLVQAPRPPQIADRRRPGLATTHTGWRAS